MSKSYRAGSIWNDRLELECFLIYKKAEQQSFKRGLVTDLCRELAKHHNIDEGTLKAKVGNYKSLGGYTKPSHASKASRIFFSKSKSISIEEIECVLSKIQCK